MFDSFMVHLAEASLFMWTDINAFLQGEINQNEDGVLCMFDETTPVKACSDFNYHFSDIGGMVFMNFFNCSSFLFFFFLWNYI